MSRIGLTTESFTQPDEMGARDPVALYVRSYLLTRTVVGVAGVLLPSLLMLLDWLVLPRDAFVRGSLSAYYHSPARDLFVGILFVVGVLLMTYLAGQRDTWDFWLSLGAGAAAIGVALVPTPRPGVAAGDPRCGVDPAPTGCTAVQQALGETVAGVLHFSFAAVFILGLGVLCFLFARRALRHDGAVRIARLFRSCGVVILVAAVGAAAGEVAGVELLGVTALYAGEVVAVYAFGLCWFVAGRRLWMRLLPPTLRPAHEPS